MDKKHYVVFEKEVLIKELNIALISLYMNDPVKKYQGYKKIEDLINSIREYGEEKIVKGQIQARINKNNELELEV